MTQVFGYQTTEGIVLATDSLALFYDDGRVRRDTVRKVIHLSPEVVLVAAGAGYGLALAQAFEQHVRQNRLWKAGDILARSLPFCRAHEESIRNRVGGPSAEHEELDRYYLLLAATRIGSSPPEVNLMLLGSEEPGDPVHPIPVGPALAIPRNMGYEVRMARLPEDQQTLEHAEEIMKGFLSRLAEKSEDVAPPFIFIRVDSDGIREHTLEQPSSESG